MSAHYVEAKWPILIKSATEKNAVIFQESDKDLVMSEQNPILLASDHAAFDLKEIVKKHLLARGIEVEDLGTHGKESVDYTAYGKDLAVRISREEATRGILLCGTGQGMCMVANRFPRVRAALCNDLYSAAMSRRHNNANILVMGSRILGDELALSIVDIWLAASFEGGRHQVRLDQFNDGIN